ALEHTPRTPALISLYPRIPLPIRHALAARFSRASKSVRGICQRRGTLGRTTPEAGCPVAPEHVMALVTQRAAQVWRRERGGWGGSTTGSGSQQALSRNL